MTTTLHEVGALLLKWIDTKQPVSVKFSGQHTNVFSLSCTGKVEGTLLLTRFKITWGNGDSVELRYDNAKSKISAEGRTLYLTYSQFETLEVSEV